MNCTKIIAPLIIGHGEGGHIVNTSSMAGLVPLPLTGLGAYQTAKFAVRGFTESLRMSMAAHGIGVSCLFPGGTRTRIIEAGAPNDAARAAARDMTASWMDPEELGAKVVEGIRNNAPYILTHMEFRDEVRELYGMLDAAFPRDQDGPCGPRGIRGAAPRPGRRKTRAAHQGLSATAHARNLRAPATVLASPVPRSAGGGTARPRLTAGRAAMVSIQRCTWFRPSIVTPDQA